MVIESEFCGQYLEGYPTPQATVLRQVDDSHAAGSEL
jgi:hypothetical protein